MTDKYSKGKALGDEMLGEVNGGTLVYSQMNSNMNNNMNNNMNSLFVADTQVKMVNELRSVSDNTVQKELPASESPLEIPGSKVLSGGGFNSVRC
jgi:hypothetical protein